MQPYPSHLVRRLALPDGTAVTIRPIRPEDADIEQAFVRGLSAKSRYFRFMTSLHDLSPRMLTHFTQVDYDRHMALIAESKSGGTAIEVGVARYITENNRQRCEFAIVIADGWQHRGLGTHLMQSLMAAARAAAIRIMYGDVLSSNHSMLRFAAKLGFLAWPDAGDPQVIRVEINL